jgi:hypothetical protein
MNAERNAGNPTANIAIPNVAALHGAAVVDRQVIAALSLL